MSESAAQDRKPRDVTLKGLVIAEIVAANPQGRLKAVEYSTFGAITRIEWYDEQADDVDALADLSYDRETISGG